MTLTKANIAEMLESEIGFTQNQSYNVVETVLEIMKRTMESGNDLLISGFGKFCVNEKKERKGRNPATGEDMPLKARRVVTFKCSRSLRERINGRS
jgi:integration host factor subunit alpha